MKKKIWEHKLIIYFLIVIVGVWLDFIHILLYTGNGWNGFGYGLEFNFDALLSIFEGLYNDILKYLKGLIQ